MFKTLLRLALVVSTFACSLVSAAIPTVDLSDDTARQVVIAQGTADTYQGHPTTLLLPDGKTMLCVWTLGHGGACGPLKRSEDGGRIWSELQPVPESWKTVRNCPALYRLTDPQGVTRLFVFAGQGPDGAIHESHSVDDGRTWSPMASVGLQAVMPFCTIVPVDGGGKTHRPVEHPPRWRDKGQAVERRRAERISRRRTDMEPVARARGSRRSETVRARSGALARWAAAALPHARKRPHGTRTFHHQR